MFSSKTTLLLLGATMAVNAQVPAIAKRDFLTSRQDPESGDFSGLGLDPACESALSAVVPLYSSLPTPPDALISATLPADPCVTPDFTGTLSEQYASWTTGALDWFTSHSDQLFSVITACSELAAGMTDVPLCTTGLENGGAGTTTTTTTITSSDGPAQTADSESESNADATTTPTRSQQQSDSSPSPTSTVPDNAAPRETAGFLVAAAAAAAFMGAVVAL